MGLALTSRVPLLASLLTHFSLYSCLSVLVRHPRLPSVRSFPFSKRARAVNTCPNICFRIISSFHYFLHLTNASLFSFIPRTITYPVASNTSSTKDPHVLKMSRQAQIISVLCSLPLESCAITSNVSRIDFPSHHCLHCRAPLARHFHQSVHRATTLIRYSLRDIAGHGC